MTLAPPRAGAPDLRPAAAPPRHPDRLHRFFEATVARCPDAVALQDGALELTYAELDARAAQLARYLQRLGAGPGRRVGILLHRTWRTYAVLLAILKSGAAFVPIDPAAPPDRVDYIRTDAGLDLLVTTSDLADGLSRDGLVQLDLSAAEVARLPRHPVEPVRDVPGTTPLAYIIYTSGSSGRPKGVAVAHPSICNFIHVITGVYDVRPHDRVYQGMTISFDFSIEEIWPTFAAGATLVVGPTDSRRIGAELGDFLADTGVTVFCCVPTLLATIPRELPALRTLLVGGEACPAGLVERWAKPHRRMLNTYGPTETTVTCTWGELLPGRPVTIGRPVPTYSAVILDDALREVARGEVGELCIGGPGVAVGYVNLPEKTADRFVRHPAAPANGDGRLYRTGDLARFDENGEIVYLGRADDEVKIRGHRVDLGEIESVALEHDDVESAVAALSKPEDGTGEELAVYVVPTAGPGGAVDTAALYDLLRTRLPEYMVPGYIDVLDRLPMMPSGKVDRPKLPAPSGPRIVVTDGPLVEPSTPLETRVREVLAEALSLEPGAISVEADFFEELGGHSLLAARVVTLLREQGVGRSPAVRDLYDNPTVRGLAAVLDPDSGVDDADGAVPPPPRPVPLRHSRRRYTAAGSAQAATMFVLMLVMTLPAAGVYAWHAGRVAPDVLAELALGATAVFLLQRWLLAPLAVRALTVGIRPGRYPMWGRVHVQLWAADLMLAMSPLPVLSGSPLAAGYLRLLGARVGRDAHIGTSVLTLPRMLDVGAGATVGYGAALHPWTLADGWVTVAPIWIGEGAHVGASAVVEPGVVIGADAVLGEQSAVGEGQVVPPGEHWSGSPSVPGSVDAAIAELSERGPAPSWTGSTRAAAFAGVVGLELVSLASLVPAVLLVWTSLLVFGEGPALAVAVAVGPVFVLTVCVLVAAGRWVVRPRTGPGIFPARSMLGLRKWFGDKLLEMSLSYTNSLYSTLYTVGWLRLLGARVGRGAEVSTASHIDPEMLTIAQGSFVADMASVGSATFHNGWMIRRPTLVGRRAFVGNAAVVPAGSSLGDESLIGVATVPPAAGVPRDTTWLGSPAMHLPVRQDSGDHPESLTFRPSPLRVAERLGIEFLRATLPASAISVSLYVFLLELSDLSRTEPLWVVVLAAPALALGTALLLALLVAAVKWLVVGSYRPRTEPLWSRFVRRSEFVTGLFEASAVPGLLIMLSGTPMLPPMLRLMGARIGRRACVSTTYLTEFDLVDIGDDAIIGRNVSLQTHLFEDRVMKMSTVTIGAGATVGDRSIVLYDAVVGAGARLDPLTLVMKGERLPAGTRWRGITARAVTDPVPERPAAPAGPGDTAVPVGSDGAALPAGAALPHGTASPDGAAERTVLVSAVAPLPFPVTPGVATEAERTAVLTRVGPANDPGRTMRMRSVVAARSAPRRSGGTGRHRPASGPRGSGRPPTAAATAMNAATTAAAAVGTAVTSVASSAVSGAAAATARVTPDSGRARHRLSDGSPAGASARHRHPRPGSAGSGSARRGNGGSGNGGAGSGGTGGGGAHGGGAHGGGAHGGGAHGGGAARNGRPAPGDRMPSGATDAARPGPAGRSGPTGPPTGGAPNGTPRARPGGRRRLPDESDRRGDR